MLCVFLLSDDYVAFLTDPETHVDGLSFSIGAALSDQKDYDSPVEVRLLKTKDKNTWSSYAVLYPEQCLPVEPASIIVIFQTRTEHGKLPSQVKKCIKDNIKAMGLTLPDSKTSSTSSNSGRG